MYNIYLFTRKHIRYSPSNRNAFALNSKLIKPEN